MAGRSATSNSDVKRAIKDASPEDPVSITLLQPEYLGILAVSNVFTIRQFAECELKHIFDAAYLKREVEIQMIHQIAKDFVRDYYPGNFRQKKSATARYGYIYVSTDTAKQVLDDQVLKSPYVLFEEYMRCPQEKKLTHPWMNAFYAHMEQTAKHLGTPDLSQVSDLDVYSYLVWRGSKSFGGLEYTAGPRAIYFHWFYMSNYVHEQCIHMDREIAAQQNPFTASRHEKLFRINLADVVNLAGGKIYSVDPAATAENDKETWIPTTPFKGCKIGRNIASLLRTFTPGITDRFEHFPYGCIVTPTGTIPAEFLSPLLFGSYEGNTTDMWGDQQHNKKVEEGNGL